MHDLAFYQKCHLLSEERVWDIMVAERQDPVWATELTEGVNTRLMVIGPLALS